jgi:hypothetical protein
MNGRRLNKITVVLEYMIIDKALTLRIAIPIGYEEI